MTLEITLRFSIGRDGKYLPPFIFFRKLKGTVVEVEGRNKYVEWVEKSGAYYYPEYYEDFVERLRKEGFEDKDIEVIVKAINKFGMFADDLSEYGEE